MIQTIHTCRKCGSTDIVKNGHSASGSQQYQCKSCGAYLVLDPKQKSYSEEEKSASKARHWVALCRCTTTSRCVCDRGPKRTDLRSALRKNSAGVSEETQLQ